MSRYYFRKNYTDFFAWCRTYVNRARWFVRYYDDNHDSVWHLNHKEEYQEALNVIRQYEVMLAVLTKEARDYFEKYLVDGKDHEWQRHDPWLKEIFDTWKEVCFPKGNPQLQSLDPIEFGRILKNLRINNGYSISKTAELLQISQTTLRSYESGESFIRIDVLYKISQIYGIKIDQILNML